MSTRQPVLATRQDFARRRASRKVRPSDVATVAAAVAAAIDETASAMDIIARRLTFDGLVAGLEHECRQIVDRHGKQSRRLRSQPWYAAEILEAIGAVRVAVARRDAPSAAAGALVAGVLAGAREAQRRHTRGARTRGKEISKEAATEDRRLAGFLNQYKMSELLQLQYRTAIAFLKERTGTSEKTIRRRLKRLQSSTSKGQ